MVPFFQKLLSWAVSGIAFTWMRQSPIDSGWTTAYGPQCSRFWKKATFSNLIHLLLQIFFTPSIENRICTIIYISIIPTLHWWHYGLWDILSGVNAATWGRKMRSESKYWNLWQRVIKDHINSVSVATLLLTLARSQNNLDILVWQLEK